MYMYMYYCKCIVHISCSAQLGQHECVNDVLAVHCNNFVAKQKTVGSNTKLVTI